MVFNLIAKVKKTLGYKRKVRIDNVVFTLHKITAGILLVLSTLVGSGVYVGKPITCTHVNDKAINRVLDAYCWIHSTFTVLNKTNVDPNQPFVAHPGVAPSVPGDDLTVHKYYQWVGFVLLFQAFAFYFPRYIWKHIEGKRIDTLSSVGFNDTARDKDDTVKKRGQCAKYFYDSLGLNEEWALKYAVCEILNFINVIFQIYLTDRFVGRALSKHGLSLLQFSNQSPMMRTDPMSQVFPTVSKCTFMMIGPTGNIVNYDSLCILPLNIYNEKFYPLLWAWFIFMAVLSGLAVIYRTATFLFPDLRYVLLQRKFDFAKAQILDMKIGRMKFDYGDWFLLYAIGKNMRPTVFEKFLSDLNKIVSEEKPYNSGTLVKEKFH